MIVKHFNRIHVIQELEASTEGMYSKNNMFTVF